MNERVAENYQRHDGRVEGREARLALGGELVPDAVNVAGGVIDPYVRPGIPLLEKLGLLHGDAAATALIRLPITNTRNAVAGQQRPAPALAELAV